MFRRLVFENSAALFTIVAFVTAVSIYVAFAWRALRMKAPQLAHFENLPFDTATPEAQNLPFDAATPAAQNFPSAPASAAPTGRNITAQGSALGTDMPQKSEALKGRNMDRDATPLQGSTAIAHPSASRVHEA